MPLNYKVQIMKNATQFSLIQFATVQGNDKCVKFTNKGVFHVLSTGIKQKPIFSVYLYLNVQSCNNERRIVNCKGQYEDT